MAEHKCINEERIRNLESDRSEIKVYIKLTREEIAETKESIKEVARALTEERTRLIEEKSSQPPKNDTWLKNIATKLVTLVGWALIIIASLTGAAQFLGKG